MKSPTMDTIKETASETSKAVDSGVRAASELLLSGAHEAAAQYGAAQERSERFMNTAIAHYRSTEDAAFNKLKGTVLQICWPLVVVQLPEMPDMCVSAQRALLS